MKNLKTISLGGQFAISYPIGIAAVPLLIFSVAFNESNVNHKYFWQWAGAAAIATLIAGTFLVIGDKTLLKRRHISPVSNGTLFLFGAFLGLIKGGATDPIAAWVFHIPGITLETGFVRAVNASVLGAMAIPLIALSAYSWHVLGEAKKLTLADIESIESLLGIEGDSVSQKQLLNEVTSKLQSARRDFNERFIVGKPKSVNEIADYLREAANSIIRPLSHEVAARPATRALARKQWNEFVDLIPDTILNTAPWMIALSAASAARSFYRVYGIGTGTFLFLLHLLLTYFTLQVIYQILRRVRINLFSVSGISILIISMQAFIIHGVVIFLKADSTTISVWASIVWEFIAFFAVCSAGIFTNSRLEYLNELRIEYSKKYSEILRRDQAQRLISTQLARYLHGTLQTRLITSAYRVRHLENGLSDSHLPSELIQIMSHFELPSKLVLEENFGDLEHQVLEIVQDWEPLLEISTNIELGGLTTDAHKASDICDVVNEALSNALRHGEASQVRVKIWVDKEEIVVSCSDNGVGFGSSHAGLGSELFDRVSESSWSLTRNHENSQTVLILRTSL